MLNRIEEVMEQYIRPRLNAHLGDVSLVDFKDGVLTIRLTGQCSSCPSAKSTIDDFIETEMIKHIPEIKKVELYEVTSSELLDFAKNILNNEKDEDRN
jgi:Fe-S cluster biogenesis protein NfuA